MGSEGRQKHALTQYELKHPGEWQSMQQKIRDRVWIDLTKSFGYLPPLQENDEEDLNANFIALKKSAKPIIKRLPQWQVSPRKMDAVQRCNHVVIMTRPKQRKTVTFADRDPTSGNVNYLDLKGVKGASVLYNDNERRPLDDDERMAAGLVIGANGKPVKKALKPVRTARPLRKSGAAVADTWSDQGFTYYSFMVGSRYNRFSTYDDLLYRDYGIMLPRIRPARAHFTGHGKRIVDEEVEDEEEADVDIRSSALTSATVQKDETPPLSAHPLSASTSELLTSVTSTAFGNDPSRLGAITTTMTLPTTVSSLASSAYYYESNRKSVRELMEHLANTLRMPPEALMMSQGISTVMLNDRIFSVSGNYLHGQQLPRSVLKAGPRGGRPFLFRNQNKNKTNPLQDSLKIDQLISFGHQMATNNYKK